MAWTAPFDPFKALGLERDAAPKTIKSKYHQLARRYHPNRHQGADESKASLSDHFYNIHLAWQLLQKADQRRRYIEWLELYDLHEAVLASAADLLRTNEELELPTEHHHAKQDGHISSDADDDDEDLPRIIGVKKRATFEKPETLKRIQTDLDGIPEDTDSDGRKSQPGRRGKTRISDLRIRANSGADSGGEQNVAAERRKKLERLRLKEFEAFSRYRDAMVDKFDAEEAADKFKEQFENARWRREYFERAPRETSYRMRLIHIFNTATKAFSAQRQPFRKRRGSTISYDGQTLTPVDPFEQKNQFLSLPSRTKSSNHRRGYSSDMSGDQTSSDESEHSSGKGTSPSRSPRPSSQKQTSSKHQRWGSLPSVVPVPTHSLPNGNFDPISPISGPGPKLFVRTPTNLQAMTNDYSSDAGSASGRSASGSSRSPLPQTTNVDRNQFQLVPSKTTGDMLGRVHDRPSRPTASADHRSTPPNGSASGTHTPHPDACFFKIKQLGRLQHHSIPVEHVREFSYDEKQSMLGGQHDSGTDARDLLRILSMLDKGVAEAFMEKPDIKEKFRFRLIYSHREVGNLHQQSFIALSYRRKLHVEKHSKHFTLPLEEEMFQAVWDERLSDREGVWIDQVCIDNDSDYEKTISMSAMDMVYRSARLVVVALDDVLLEGHEAQILENHMEEFARQIQIPQNKRFRRRQTPYLESHEDLYVVVRKLMESSWFRRAWCRHEMRLAQEHIFLVPCKSPGSWSSKSVIRFTGKCLTHFLGLATEVPFERSIEDVKPALYAFFRDRSKATGHEDHLRSHHGNFTTVVAEVFAMEAGGDPRIPEEQRQADARKDKISIILNTMECGLVLCQNLRNPKVSLPTPQCNYMLLLLALAARDPGALSSVGHPLPELPYGLQSSWLLEPTNVDSGLNNYRTLERLPARCQITTGCVNYEQYVQLDLKFLRPEKPKDTIEQPPPSQDTINLARHFAEVCEKKQLGRNRKRYMLNSRSANEIFGSMREVYVQTLVCLFECGPDWMTEVCQRYGVSRWRHDLHAAWELLVAFKNTRGRWPESAWTNQAAGFIIDFVNFLIIRGMPQRILTRKEEWRPVWRHTPGGGVVLTFVPHGNIDVAVPAALLDSDYLHLARLWVLEPRGECNPATEPQYREWTLLGKSVLFSNDKAIQLLELDNGFIRGEQKVFGRGAA